MKNLYDIRAFRVSKHSLARFMQRNKMMDPKKAKEKMVQALKKTTLVWISPDGREKRNYNNGDESVMFICRRANYKGLETLFVITTLISKRTQIKNFSRDINSINYEEIGAFPKEDREDLNYEEFV